MTSYVPIVVLLVKLISTVPTPSSVFTVATVIFTVTSAIVMVLRLKTDCRARLVNASAIQR